MARQLSEQLEREVNAEELLKTQSKPNPAANSPSIGGAIDPASGTAAEPPAIADPPAIAPEPVYGAHASMTTPEAMHANDPPVAAAATDPKPPHE
jgi:hypothetical protein